MLTEICQDLHNWFDRGQPKWTGSFTVVNGNITSTDSSFQLKDGQYFRIMGSTFSDGVHLYPASDLTAEEFEGTVWAMAVPPSVIALASQIAEWCEKYMAVDSVNMSPYVSESFGGYSYSKSGGGSSSDGSGTWQNAFAKRLNMWRKLP